MENQNTGVAVNPRPIKDFFSKDVVKAKINELMGKRSASFITAVLQIVNQSEMLSKATPESIFHSAVVAATLDLNINSNLGYAYIIPYNEKVKGVNGGPDTWRTSAQFQLGYKGFIQLAQRSGQFKTISCTDVRDGEIMNFDRLTGEISFDWKNKGRSDLKIIGYVAYFKLLNGFEKSLYMTTEELTAHVKKFSKTFIKGFGLWKDDFDGMASKTVLKLLLSRFAPLSVEMQTAVVADQAIIQDSETMEVTYVDNSQAAETQYEDVLELYGEVSPALTPDEVRSARRILGLDGEEPETNSFEKLKKMLESKKNQ